MVVPVELDPGRHNPRSPYYEPPEPKRPEEEPPDKRIIEKEVELKLKRLEPEPDFPGDERK